VGIIEEKRTNVLKAQDKANNKSNNNSNNSNNDYVDDSKYN
jgi:hypothetical protein